MKILAFDVSVKGCGVAVFDGATANFDSQYLETDKGQAEHLVPLIEDILSKSKTDIKDIARIATTRGPGSFTGVRIGLATARTLGLALSVPVLGFSTLELLLKEFPDSLVAIDTKREDFYCLSKTMAPQILTEEQMTELNLPIIRDTNPSLKIMTQCASAIDDAMFPEYPVTPIYMREAETSQPKHNKAVGNCPNPLS
ncbi:MAG TPA: tRNA (adenosine(37)-N6)-threonylcarbamoyltransferase complex dimerization subunit type 1 TsaB [Alphaproteobacteria bacterium]|nr:tRNA (adenosine(37)-N6)-threonylcarbamoyltransferase complex dimerization subunit type 1 TsaB [Alphaproteobacteria bacterium]HOO51086.1 tRNA (adenosine(37)-N6)-threonylcarbamoyltransferase complex dimerization subunit type 1 TsaB [Alphaproteobacteria bacterium]